MSLLNTIAMWGLGVGFILIAVAAVYLLAADRAGEKHEQEHDERLTRVEQKLQAIHDADVADIEAYLAHHAEGENR